MIRRWIARLLFGWGISTARSSSCVPSHTCEASEFWRQCADRAHDEATVYVLQLRELGHRPVHRDDGVVAP